MLSDPDSDSDLDYKHYWLHCNMQNFSRCMIGFRFHPNCNVREWDWNRNRHWNRNPPLWMCVRYTNTWNRSKNSLLRFAYFSHLRVYALPFTIKFASFLSYFHAQRQQFVFSYSLLLLLLRGFFVFKFFNTMLQVNQARSLEHETLGQILRQHVVDRVLQLVELKGDNHV